MSDTTSEIVFDAIKHEKDTIHKQKFMSFLAPESVKIVVMSSPKIEDELPLVTSQ